MLRRPFLLLLILALWLPTRALGQEAEPHETETIEPPPSWKGSVGKAPDLAKITELVTQYTNEFREQEGVARLRSNPNLEKTAASFADYMACTDRYGHEADGNRPADRAKKHGYDYCIVAENIAYYYSSAPLSTEELARNFFKGWKESPPHRRNMLDPDVIDMGVAVARSEKTGYYYAVQDFGRPASDRIEFRISNHTDAPVEYRIGDRTLILHPGYTRIHERCRPPQVVIGPFEGKAKKTLRPVDGNRYVIEKNDAGEVVVRKQS